MWRCCSWCKYCNTKAVNSAKIVSESMHEYLQEVAEEAAI